MHYVRPGSNNIIWHTVDEPKGRENLQKKNKKWTNISVYRYNDKNNETRIWMQV